MTVTVLPVPKFKHLLLLYKYEMNTRRSEKNEWIWAVCFLDNRIDRILLHIVEVFVARKVHFCYFHFSARLKNDGGFVELKSWKDNVVCNLQLTHEVDGADECTIDERRSVDRKIDVLNYLCFGLSCGWCS